MPLHSRSSTITRRDLLKGAALGVSAANAPAPDAAPVESDHSRPTIAPPCAPADAPLRDLNGKVAFITGGSSGIGLGIAQACVQAGMKVSISYRSKEHLEAALKKLPTDRDRVHAVKVDVTDANALHRAAEECVAHFGKVHLLVNNAGVQDLSPLSTITREQWDQLMNVNVVGVLNGVQSFLPYLIGHREGAHIVSTSSILGLFTIGPAMAAYCASKFAVVAMMESLRAELAEVRVGVSILCPGVVRSNLGKGLADNPAASDPYEVGVMLLEGVRRNELYVLTHPEFGPILQNRCALIARSVSSTELVPESRQLVATATSRQTIYEKELTRSTC